MEFNEIVKELVEFCYINSLMIREFRLGYGSRKTYAKTMNYTNDVLLEFVGEWRYAE